MYNNINTCHTNNKPTPHSPLRMPHLSPQKMSYLPLIPQDIHLNPTPLDIHLNPTHLVYHLPPTHLPPTHLPPTHLPPTHLPPTHLPPTHLSQTHLPPNPRVIFMTVNRNLQEMGNCTPLVRTLVPTFIKNKRQITLKLPQWRRTILANQNCRIFNIMTVSKISIIRVKVITMVTRITMLITLATLLLMNFMLNIMVASLTTIHQHFMKTINLMVGTNNQHLMVDFPRNNTLATSMVNFQTSTTMM
jgi:hypothetical protein